MDIDQPDVWTLVQNGYFEQACNKADAEHAETGNIFPLRNKVYALFHLGKYEECISLTQRLIAFRNGETDWDFIFCGIANWALGRKEEAVAIWKQGEQSIYKDAAGGMDSQVINYFASVVLRDEGLKKDAIKKIKKILRSKRSVNWPGVLGSFLLGDMDESTLVCCVSDVPILRERNLCQAYFTAGIRQLERGEMQEFRKRLQLAVGYGPPAYLEQVYYLAKYELGVGGESV